MFKIIIILLVFSTSLFSKEFVVVINSHNHIKKIEAVSDYFLLHLETWDNKKKKKKNEKVVPVFIRSSSNKRYRAINETFVKNVLGLTMEQYSKHWLDAKASGKTIRPTTVNNFRVARVFLQKKIGSIGYLPANMVTSKMRVVAKFKVK